MPTKTKTKLTAKRNRTPAFLDGSAFENEAESEMRTTEVPFTNDPIEKLNSEGMPESARNNYFLAAADGKQLAGRREANVSGSMAKAAEISDAKARLQFRKQDHALAPNPNKATERGNEIEQKRIAREEAALAAERAAHKDIPRTVTESEILNGLRRERACVFRVPMNKPEIIKGETLVDLLSAGRTRIGEIPKDVRAMQKRPRHVDDIIGRVQSYIIRTFGKLELSELDAFFELEFPDSNDTKGRPINPNISQATYNSLQRFDLAQRAVEHVRERARQFGDRAISDVDRQAALIGFKVEHDRLDRIDCELVRRIRAANPNAPVYFRKGAHWMHVLDIEVDPTVIQPKPGNLQEESGWAEFNRSNAQARANRHVRGRA